MGLELATYIGDLNSSNPVAGDDVAQGDDHLRLVKTVLKTTFPDADRAFRFFRHAAKTADYTVLSTDEHKFFSADGTSASVDLTLPSLASGDAGWWIVVRAINLTNAVRVVPASGTINGASALSFTSAGQSALVWWTGSLWYASVDLLVDIVNATAETAPASGDSLLLYDLSATANRKMTLANLLKVINDLTAETSPAADDVMLLYDTSAGTADKITLENLLKVINALTEDTAPDSTADYVVTYDASASLPKKVKTANLMVGLPILHMQDQKTSGTNGGTFTSGAWRTRTLNTTVTNTISGASLSSDQFTLPAGTYWIQATLVARGCMLHKAKLYNVTDAADVLIGTTEETNNAVGYNTHSVVHGQFTITGAKVFDLRHYCSASGTFGNAASFGVVEVYADVIVWKVT